MNEILDILSSKLIGKMFILIGRNWPLIISPTENLNSVQYNGKWFGQNRLFLLHLKSARLFPVHYICDWADKGISALKWKT